jgi:transcriptional regulator with XRE-family HTH domain
MNSLGSFVCQRRKALGLRQQDLADELGYSVQAISKFENQQTQMDIASLPRLAQVLKLSLEDLLQQNPNPVAPPCSVVFSGSILAANLLYFRKSVYATRGQVASWMGVSKRSVANYERGVSLPSVASLSRLLAHYHVTADDFFGKNLSQVVPAQPKKSRRRPLLISLGAVLFLALIVGASAPFWLPQSSDQPASQIGDESVGSSAFMGSSSAGVASSSADSLPSSPSGSFASGDDLDAAFPGLKEFSLRNNDASSATVGPGDYVVSLHCEPANYIEEQGYSLAWSLAQDIEGVSLSAGGSEYLPRTVSIAKNVANGTRIILEGILSHNGTALKRRCVLALVNPSGELSTNFPGIVAFYVTINGASDVSLTPGNYPIEIHSPDAEGNDVSLANYRVDLGLNAPVPQGFLIQGYDNNTFTFMLGDDAGDGVSISCGPALVDPRTGKFIFGTMGLNVTAVNPGH